MVTNFVGSIVIIIVCVLLIDHAFANAWVEALGDIVGSVGLLIKGYTDCEKSFKVNF